MREVKITPEPPEERARPEARPVEPAAGGRCEWAVPRPAEDRQGGWYRGRAPREAVSSLRRDARRRKVPIREQHPASRRSSRYRAVPPQVDLPAMEHAILDFWRDQKVFPEELGADQGRPALDVLRGPPTANGMPGTHHVEARVFKDVFPRYRTMRGHWCPARPAGTATACRSSSRWSRSSASPASRTSRRTASPSSTRGAGRRSNATSTRSRR